MSHRLKTEAMLRKKVLDVDPLHWLSTLVENVNERNQVSLLLLRILLRLENHLVFIFSHSPIVEQEKWLRESYFGGVVVQFDCGVPAESERCQPVR